MNDSARDQPDSATDPTPLLRVEDLVVTFNRGQTVAVDGARMTIYPNQTLAVVGESGSGKSVTALSTLQLVPTPPGRYDAGRIIFDGQDLLELSAKQMQKVRGNDIAMIFQEPMTSLNPVYTIGDQILEAVLLHQQVSRSEAVDIAEQALRDVGIAEPRGRLSEYPHQLSGGMRQRIMIAMALACKPRLLLADEPTTALDVTIQAQILELLRELQNQHGMAMMLITHDLGVVAENADAVAVMYAGRIVEYGSVVDIFDNPVHPYTRGLLASIPRLGSKSQRLRTISDESADHSLLPEGYRFDEHWLDPEKQTGIKPRLYEIEDRRWVLCHHEGERDDAAPTSFPDVTFRREADVGEISNV